MFSEPPPATHKLVEGHEMALIALLPSMLVMLQVGLEFAGFVEVKTLPTRSTPTQRPVDGQEIAKIGFIPSTLTLFQLL
jgi:hypothetical protein